MSDYRSRPAIRVADGCWTIRASALGSCMRDVVRRYTTGDTSYPAYVEAAATAGRLAEDELVAWAGQELGRVLAREVECKLTGHGWVVTGHADGVGDDVVVEAKTVSTIDQVDHRRRLWRYQLGAYQHALDLPNVFLPRAYYAVGGRRDGKRVLVKADDLPSWDALVERVQALVRAAETGAWEDIECECGYCPSQKVEVDDPSILALVDEYLEITRIEQTANERKKELAQMLLSAREWQKGDRVSTDRGSVVYVPPANWRHFDTRQHAKDHPDCHQQYESQRATAGYLRAVFKEDER